ncbi:MAG: UDP-N-acetylmuramate dehydrogenase [Candidatus Aureabacteria bacterium]|nr:UDP-N-acetylmuramate dehydrogenase [Candidatus Auribacterota bacterium]
MNKIKDYLMFIKENNMKSKFKQNVSLSLLTTIKVGGNVPIVVDVENEAELIGLVNYALKTKINYRVIGNGSNLIFRDSGYKGIIFRLKGRIFKKIEATDKGVIAGASVSSKRLVDFCTSHSVGGFEFLAGIPGTVGGMILTNAGAFSKSISNILCNVRLLFPNGKICWCNSAEFEFGYRSAKGFPKCGVIIQALFKKRKAKIHNIRKKVKNAILKRNKNQPKGRSAGSIFKNPEGFKSWELIDTLGMRGISVSGACVSNVHSNWIINKNNASSKDIKMLVKRIQKKTFEKFGIKLKTEVEFI